MTFGCARFRMGRVVGSTGGRNGKGSFGAISTEAPDSAGRSSGRAWKGMEGRSVIVTGAAHGIGLAIATRMARAGERVLMVDVDPLVKSQCQALHQEGHPATAAVADVTDATAVEGFVGALVEKTGRVDVLVNNAGITGGAKPTWEYAPDEWSRVFAVNLTGPFLCCRSVVPRMLRQGGGRIVNVASISGKEGNPNMAAYSSSKAALIGFTKSLAKEVATRNVFVNCVTPAVIETEILQQLNEETVGYMLQRIPMGRPGQPSEVAELVAWLASDACSFSTGAVFDISGGRATY